MVSPKTKAMFFRVKTEDLNILFRELWADWSSTQLPIGQFPRQVILEWFESHYVWDAKSLTWFRNEAKEAQNNRTSMKVYGHV